MSCTFVFEDRVFLSLEDIIITNICKLLQIMIEISRFQARNAMNEEDVACVYLDIYNSRGFDNKK